MIMIDNSTGIGFNERLGANSNTQKYLFSDDIDKK